MLILSDHSWETVAKGQRRMAPDTHPTDYSDIPIENSTKTISPLDVVGSALQLGDVQVMDTLPNEARKAYP